MLMFCPCLCGILLFFCPKTGQSMNWVKKKSPKSEPVCECMCRLMDLYYIQDASPIHLALLGLTHESLWPLPGTNPELILTWADRVHKNGIIPRLEACINESFTSMFKANVLAYVYIRGLNTDNVQCCYKILTIHMQKSNLGEWCSSIAKSFSHEDLKLNI